MNILIVSQYFWPERFRINDLAIELKKNFNIEILTGYPNYPDGNIYDEFVSNHKKFKIFQNMRVIRVPIIPRKKNKFFLFLNYLSFVICSSLFILLFSKKYDLVLTYQTSPIFSGTCSVLLKKIKKIPHILWVQDLWPDTIFNMDIFKNNFIKKIIKKYSIYIYKNCDHIISQSDGIKKKLNKYLENKVKITVIRNWPELEFSDKKESKKIDFPKKNINNFDILFSGNIGEAQDMESVLECVKISKKDKKIRWIFLGSGSKFLWLKQKKIENNLENLFLLGNKPSNQMMQYYSLSDALLISLKPGPAFKIVVPSKFVSYLKSSKPIVGMIDGETNNIINDNKIGYSCRAGDYFELFNNIKKLKKNYKKKLYFFKKNSEKLFNKSFKRDNQILKIINVINEVK